MAVQTTLRVPLAERPNEQIQAELQEVFQVKSMVENRLYELCSKGVYNLNNIADPTLRLKLEQELVVREQNIAKLKDDLHFCNRKIQEYQGELTRRVRAVELLANPPAASDRQLDESIERLKVLVHKFLQEHSRANTEIQPVQQQAPVSNFSYVEEISRYITALDFDGNNRETILWKVFERIFQLPLTLYQKAELLIQLNDHKLLHGNEVARIWDAFKNNSYLQGDPLLQQYPVLPLRVPSFNTNDQNFLECFEYLKRLAPNEAFEMLRNTSGSFRLSFDAIENLWVQLENYYHSLELARFSELRQSEVSSMTPGFLTLQHVPTPPLEKREYPIRAVGVIDDRLKCHRKGVISSQRETLRNIATEINGPTSFRPKKVDYEKRDRYDIRWMQEQIDGLKQESDKIEDPELKTKYLVEIDGLQASNNEDLQTLLDSSTNSLENAHKVAQIQADTKSLRAIHRKSMLKASGEWDKKRYGDDPARGLVSMTKEQLEAIEETSKIVMHSRAKGFAKAELELEPPKANPVYAMPPRKSKPKRNVRFADENVAHVIVENGNGYKVDKTVRIPMNR